MRSLVILRGSPASGKSTWVKEMGLESYTLSADDIRLLVESPILVPDKTHRVISQENDNYVWTLLYELLEKRMARGEFVIVDATHSRSSDFSRYNKLCERYRYRKFYVDFSDVPIEECKRRNSLRPDYKQVPEKVIEKMYSRLKTQGKTSGYTEADKVHFWDTVGTKIFNFDKYENIFVFGDIHGCYEPLKTHFEKFPYSENDMYIFTGDYLDRGIQNKEVLEFLIDFSKKPNVLLLEGNHEKWLKYYAFDEIELIESNEFLKRTIPQIIDIPESDIRNLYRKIGQIAFFNFRGRVYIISHGGVPYLPDQLQLVATEQFVNGVGDYNTDIDEIFHKNYAGIRQIHGHRNTYEIDEVGEHSFNLEGKVEFGGNLKVMVLSDNGDWDLMTYKNDVFRTFDEPEEIKELPQEQRDALEMVEMLRQSRDIRETKLGGGISSFNFTRNAFYKKHWDEITTTARGLFIDTNTGKIVARGYQKFFNVNERRETELEHLIVKFKDKKITMYKKENGFLGIMSWVNNEMFLASKSTNQGDFAGYFKALYEKSNIDKEKLELFLKSNDVSLVWEVIDIENDPHIIEYPESKLVLLDIIHNQYEFKREPYEELRKLAKYIGCECKTIYEEFDNVREFHNWYIENTDEDNMSHVGVEGVVIECGDFMTKLKFPYYNFWKLMRGTKDKLAAGHSIKLSRMFNATANYFLHWAKQQDTETLGKDIITLRKRFEEETNYEIHS